MGDEATLGELRDRVAAFVAARDWEKFHHPKDLALALTVEASELLELFRWRSREEVDAMVSELRQPIAEELADVFIFGLSLANALALDLTGAIQRKMAANEERFPVETYRGRAYAGPADSSSGRSPS
ncbi:MAG: nucleotide pyrophosphohydrolase [Thermoplasmata archaeon]|nr:nucleotide pyrophosphohydrolase [Thermoplasmata archaeon]